MSQIKHNKAQHNRAQHNQQQPAEPFLLLPENEFAYTALKELTTPGKSPKGRLVYLHGPSGCGKTQLGLSFLQEMKKQYPDTNSLRITASQFGADYAEATDANVIDEFRQTFADVDLFICEDLAALEQRLSTANLLTILIDQIYHSGGRILLTAHSAPGKLNGVPVKLVNRCHGGTCLKISHPERASRIKLLEHFCEYDNRPLSSAAIEMVAAELAVSPRELRAALLQIHASAEGNKITEIDIPFVQQFLAAETKRVKPTLSQITRVVAKQFGVSVAAIRSRSQTVDITQPRQCAMLLARKMTDLSLRDIADYFGRRNHSTVIHACNRFEKLLTTDSRLQLLFRNICDATGGEIPD